MAFDASALSSSERFVIERTAEGEIADLAAGGGEKPPLRANFLRRLLLQIEAGWPVRLPGVRIVGARIEGALDLSDCASGVGLPALELIACDIPEPLDFSHARLARLSFKDSALSILKGHALHLDGPLDLSGVHPVADGALCWIDVRGATIEGRVEGAGAQLRIDESLPAEDGVQQYALNLRETRIGGGVCLRPNFHAVGGVSLFDADVDGLIDFRGAHLKAIGRRALNLGNVKATGVVSLNRGFRCEGPIWMRGARMEGGFNADGGVIAVKSGEAEGLNAEAAVIGEDVQLRNRFSCNAPVTFAGADVRGNVRVDGGLFSAQGPIALDLRNAIIGGDVIGALVVQGGVRVAGAEIKRNLDLRGAEITQHAHRNGGKEETYGTALDATNARVGGAVLFQGAKLKGEALFADARIEGYCGFGGGRFINGHEWAIRAPNARIGGNLTFKSAEGEAITKTVIEGGAKFDRATIEGEAIWDGLELRGQSPGRKTGPTLSFVNARIGRKLAARSLIAQTALIDLSGASCAGLDDDLKHGWGLSAARINLEGFAYERLEGNGAEDRWRARCKWLSERSETFSPQPYAALAAVYARAGRREDMRRVLLAERDARTKSAPLYGPTRWLSSLFGVIAGYGFAPMRAARALALFLILGTAGVFVMNERGALIDGVGARCAARIEPALYALDVALPVIDLGQESACGPGRAAGAPLGAGREIPGTEWRLFEEVALWRWAHGAYAILGAILGALAIITFSGVLKPKGEE